MVDLADRISRAAVAALDLAPFDDRFGRLSRQVLAGGATRFQRVIADDQAVDYVIPVGLVGQRIDYGALVLQDRQSGILWRDALGIDHAVVVPRSDAAATFSPLTLGGEEWVRFDVDGSAERMSFLIPPVSDPLLRRTLVNYFQARPGPRSGDAVPDMAPAAAPAVRFPEPDPDPEPEPEAEPESVETTAVLPVTEPAEGWAVEEPAAEEPAAETLAVGDTTAAETLALGERALTHPTEPVDPADALTEWHLDDAPTQLHLPEEEPATAFVPPAPVRHEHAAPFDLYRDEQPAPAWGAAATQAMPTPVPSPSPQAEPWPPQPASQQWGPAPMSATTRPTEPASGYEQSPQVYAQPSGTSRTLVGFLLGLFGTLAIGGAVIIANLIGG